MKKSKAQLFMDSISKASDYIVSAQSKAPKNYALIDQKLIDFENGAEITMDDIFGGESNENLKLLDKWVEKQLLGNPDIKPYSKRPYPYKKYNMIDDILRKHGMDFISKLRFSLPSNLKKNTEEETFIDSVAWVIWDKKLDLKSIIPNLPEFGSVWDRISEDGYAE